MKLQCTQGRAPYGITIRIEDASGRELPRDGVACGHLKVRGPWVAAGYYRDEGGAVLDADGWFDTGDIATIDPDGFMHITDRAKDVIKSGGEWISSIDLENAAAGHPAVAEAAVIGVADPKWQERPLLVLVKKPGQGVTREAMLAFLEGKVAKWWLPDDVQFVEQLPHSATGKVYKMELRKQFSDYRFPGT
jgi:fatty-acyl-CoA synthase